MENKIKALFIQNPKTATTSLCRIFKVEHNHNTLGYYQEEGVTYDYSFAFVRNTYTRLVSWYRHQHGYEIEGFREWVHNGCLEEWDDDWIASWQDNNPMDQMLYIKDKNGNIGVDFIGFFENLNNDYIELCHQLNITKPTKLPKVIPRPGRDDKQKTSFSYNAREYYDIETRQKVDELFKEEINHFNFKFFKE